MSGPLKILTSFLISGAFSAVLTMPGEAAEAASSDLEWQRCQSAENVGRTEGEFLLQSTLHDAEQTCAKLKSSADYYWLQALTLRNFLWDTGSFQPLAGLEEYQECRMQGQNLGMEASSQKLRENCL